MRNPYLGLSQKPLDRRRAEWKSSERIRFVKVKSTPYLMVEFNLSKWNFRFQSTTPARKTMDFCVFPRFSTITAGPRPIRRPPDREHVPCGTNVFLPENSFEKGCGMTPQGHTAALLLPVAALHTASVCRQGASIYSYIFPYR